MSVIKMNKTKIMMVCIIGIVFIVCFAFSKSFGMQHYYNLDFSTGLVTATTLNVRSGPGVNYGIITTVKKNEYIRVFAGIGDWYIVQVEGDYIGAVSKKYIKPIYPSTGNTSGNSNNSSNSGTSATSELTADEKEVFNLINIQRKNNGLQELKIDSEVQRVARIKAQDMNDNNYFAHESPIYGSPFQMLSSFKISYKTAGENIAANSSNSAAVTAWMNSSGHKANILNSSYNYTGIGVVNNSKYGKLYVQIFIGK